MVCSPQTQQRCEGLFVQSYLCTVKYHLTFFLYIIYQIIMLPNEKGASRRRGLFEHFCHVIKDGDILSGIVCPVLGQTFEMIIESLC